MWGHHLRTRRTALPCGSSTWNLRPHHRKSTFLPVSPERKTGSGRMYHWSLWAPKADKDTEELSKCTDTQLAGTVRRVSVHDGVICGCYLKILSCSLGSPFPPGLNYYVKVLSTERHQEEVWALKAPVLTTITKCNYLCNYLFNVHLL